MNDGLISAGPNSRYGGVFWVISPRLAPFRSVSINKPGCLAVEERVKLRPEELNRVYGGVCSANHARPRLRPERVVATSGTRSASSPKVIRRPLPGSRLSTWPSTTRAGLSPSC